MAKIKGLYVAKIKMDFEIDEFDPKFLPLDEIERQIKDELTPNLRDLIIDEFGEEDLHLSVIQTYADVWRAEE